MKRALIFFTCILLIGCAPASPTPAPTPTIGQDILSTQAAATALAELTRQAIPPTPSATLTASPTPQPSQTPTPAATPTPLARFAEFVITRAAYQRVGGVSLTIKLPGIASNINLEINGSKFTCAFDPAYSDVVVCNGLYAPPLDTRLPIAFTDPLSGQALYQGEVILRQTMFPTPTPISPAGNWCPERGTKVEVEWECRIYQNNPCVVATVFDACGYWYSVHTCPDNMDLPSPNCSAEQFDAMRKLHGFP